MPEKKNLRPWLVLLGCCMMQGGSMGVVSNSMGVFFAAINRDLGIPVGEISLYKTVVSLSSCIVLPFVGRILYRSDTRLTLTFSAVVMAVSTLLMGRFSQLWQWYAAAFFVGLSGAMLFQTAQPIILSNWFHEKLGLAIGISAASSGLLGTASNMALERVITVWGWRMGYTVAAAVSALMIIPMTLFVIRLKPEMVGCVPYGVRQESVQPEEQTLGLKGTSKGLLMTALFLAAASMMFCTGFSPQIVNYSISMGKSMTTGALLVSYSMISNAAGKVLLGAVNDAKGLKWTCAAGFLFCIPSFIMFFSDDLGIMTAGSLAYGVGMALAVITPPLLTRKFFRGSDYPRAFPRVMMLATLISAFSTGVLGSMYDRSGSYRTAIILCLGMCGVYALMCTVLFVSYRRLQRQPSDNR